MDAQKYIVAVRSLIKMSFFPLYVQWDGLSLEDRRQYPPQFQWKMYHRFQSLQRMNQLSTKQQPDQLYSFHTINLSS